MGGHELPRQAVGLAGAEQDPVAGGQANERGGEMRRERHGPSRPCRAPRGLALLRQFVRRSGWRVPPAPKGREPLELAAQDAKLLDMKLACRTTANVPRHRILIRQAKLAVGERLQQVGDLFTACCAHLLHHSPMSASRKARRARDRRDMTVPMGSCVTSAIS